MSRVWRITIAGILCWFCVYDAHSQGQELLFDIPSMPLSDAILQFSEQSDATLIAPPDLLEGKISAPLTGTQSKEKALQTLLKNTGLDYQITDNGNIRITETQVIAILPIATKKSPSYNDDDTMEEIIVSSGRREQLQLKYAGTVNAFDNDALARLGTGYDFQSIQAAVPGLQISQNEGFQEIFVRGIGTQDNSISSDQPTAVHYNNIYISKLRGLGPVMFDIERLEVHQGPQGTLRGRNATAGTINIISKSPQLNEFSNEVSLETGSFDLLTKQLFTNLPVIEDKLAVRLSYHSRQHDDLYTNARRPEDAYEEVNGAGAENENAWRASAKWLPTDNITFSVVYDNSSSAGTGFAGNYAGQTFSQGIAIEDLDDPWNQFFQTQGRVKIDVESLLTTTTITTDDVVAEIILSTREHEGLTVNPRRPFQHGFVNRIVQTVDDISIWEPDNYNTNWISDASQTKSVEIRLSSPDLDTPFFWTTGVYFFDESSSEFRWDISDAPALAQTNLGGPDFTQATAFSRSFYFDTTYQFAEKWRITAGARYTNERKTSARWDAVLIFDETPDTLDLDNDGNTEELITLDNDLGQLVRLGTRGFNIVPSDDLALISPDEFNSASEFLNYIVADFGERDNLQQIIANDPNNGRIETIAPGGIANTRFNDSYINWRLGLEYDVSSTHLLYANASTGTRAGGINPPIFIAGNRVQDTFDNEELLALEIGSKSRFHWLNRPVTLSLSAFHYQYKNQIFQVGTLGDSNRINPGISNFNADLRQTNVNIGESRAAGITLDNTMSFGYGLSLGWNILYLETKILEGSTVDGRQRPQTVTVDGEDILVAPPIIDLAGNSLINSPRVSSNVSISQLIRLETFGSFDWTISASYKSHFYATPFQNKGYNFQGEAIPLRDMLLCCQTQFADANGDGETEIGDGRFFNDRVPSSLILNANLGFNFGNYRQHRLEFYVHNLTKEAYAQKQIINAAVNIAFLNTPRMFGIRFNTSF